MLESLVRGNLQNLQRLYDRFPSPARNVLTSARGLLLARIRNAGPTHALLHELRSHESFTAVQITALQLLALRKIVDHARTTVPHYASRPNLYPPKDFLSFEDLRAYPVLSRDVVRENAADFLSQAVPPAQRIPASTTGTTGANLKIAYTEHVARANWAFTLRQWAWAGVAPRHPRITLFGARVVPVTRTAPPFWTHNIPDRQILASIFHLSEKNAPAYLAFLRTQRGKILEGFPSVLGILADFAQARGEQLPMRAVFTTGEPLYPHLRQKIESAFAARAFDQYGMTEYCGLIQECERGGMHLIPEYGFLEILNDSDNPVPPGEEGHFVWTGFLNRAMPLIRYRIGDRGRWHLGPPCSCGRAFPLVVPTITRESDLLRLPDGRVFSPRALNQLLKDSAALRFCQFVHPRPNRVVVRAVPSTGNNTNGHALSEASAICSRLRELLGPQVEVTFELASDPLTRAGGKIPLILNQSHDS